MDESLTRRERKKQTTRELLLKVALRLISQKGIYVTTIEDVTEKADIGKGTFYQYFSSKEELLAVLLKEGLKALLHQSKKHLKALKSAKTIKSQLVRAHLEFLFVHPEYRLLFHQVLGLLQLKQQVAVDLRRVYEDYLVELSELISPTISRQERHEVGLALMAFSTGLATHHLLFHQRMGFKLNKKAIEKRIVRAL